VVATVERIIAGAARNDVVEVVADAGEAAGADVRQVLDIVVEKEPVLRRRGTDLIDALAGELGDMLVDVVEIENVIAGAAGEVVKPRSTIQGVVTRAAGERIG